MPMQNCELSQVMVMRASLWDPLVTEVLTPLCLGDIRIYFLFVFQEFGSIHITRKI